MGGRKRQIKDPIYGYINLPDGIVQSIVDTPEFQRLRKITQTSYEALYPSATHNRFAHSLGVFHLGSLVAKAIEGRHCLAKWISVAVDVGWRYHISPEES